VILDGSPQEPSRRHGVKLMVKSLYDHAGNDAIRRLRELLQSFRKTPVPSAQQLAEDLTVTEPRKPKKHDHISAEKILRSKTQMQLD